jgi:hypothetical protein
VNKSASEEVPKISSIARRSTTHKSMAGQQGNQRSRNNAIEFRKLRVEEDEM